MRDERASPRSSWLLGQRQVSHWTWAPPLLQTCCPILCWFPVRFLTLCCEHRTDLGISRRLLSSLSLGRAISRNCRTALSCHYQRLGSGENHVRLAEGLTWLQGLPLWVQIRVQHLTATWDLAMTGLPEPQLAAGTAGLTPGWKSVLRAEVGIQLRGLSKPDTHMARRAKPAAEQQDRDQTLRDGKGGAGQGCVGGCMPSPAG